MRKLSLVTAIALLFSVATIATAQPPSFIDLGFIGDAGDYTFDTIGSGFDTELGLWDFDGNIIASDDDGGPGLESQIDINLADGIYYLGISEFNSIFEDGFVNSGSAFEAGEMEVAVLNINGSFGGSIEVGEVAGLPETGFFRVAVGIPEPSMAFVVIGFVGTALARRRR